MLAALAFAGALLLAPSPSAPQLPAIPEKPVRIGRNPALSPDGSKLCFTYQGNLWVVPSEGGVATRLTANDSVDLAAKWSPDGNWIAFNSDREGGNQVFVMPAVGGPARQVTCHSSGAALYDWYPDGKSLLVASSRDTRHLSLFKLDVASGRMKKVIEDNQNCKFATVSPDGNWIAFTRGALADTIRKGYHGSANYDVYVAPADGSSPAKPITDSDRNDMWPVWSADSKTVYFSSERGGLATVWKCGRDGGKQTQVVQSPPDAVRYLSSARNGGLLAYESDDQICVTPATGGPAKVLSIICRTDERGPKTTYQTFNSNGATEFALSPDGKRTAFGVRGDIFVVNNEKGGEAKRVTDNPTRDQNMVWTTDGKSLIYSSNRTGDYKLYRTTLATMETAQLTKGPGNDDNPRVSPDGAWIVYTRSPQTSIRLVKPDGTGDHEAIPGPKLDDPYWSPDGKWIAYVREDDIRTNDIWVASVAADGTVGKPLNVSDHPGFNDRPRWTADGAKLIFRSNRYRNRDIETINHTGRYTLYTVSLQKDKDKFEEDDDAPKPPAEAEDKTKPKKVEVKIDPDEIERRAKPVVGIEEGVGIYSVSPDGKTIVFAAGVMGTSDLWQVNTEGGTITRLTTGGENTSSIQWAPDSSKFYYVGSGGTIRSIARGGGPAAPVSFTARMQIDRLIDYYAVYDEAAGVIRNTFYDPTFRGQDINKLVAKYRARIEDVTVRSDFNWLMTELLAELNSSHTGYGAPGARAARPTGCLGVIADDDYAGPGVRIAKVVKRSPADKEESRLKPGEYIVSVDGKDVVPGYSFDDSLNDKTGRTVTLLVNSAPNRTGARTVKIKPISTGAWNGLLYEQWIDQRRDVADKASNGRIGYLHVADMGDSTRNRFERELFSIGMRKDAMVLDFRGNNGGDTHDSLLRILERNSHYFSMVPRTETGFPQPEKAYTKPVIVLMDEFSLSDAEVFANGFKEKKLGKIVGRPTMGWIIFTSGQALVDGSFIRQPYIACLTNDGRDMELWGVPPDIEVPFTPADFVAGRDPQLERAIQELLKDPRMKR